MARTSKLTDEAIRTCLAQGMTQEEIALSYSLTPGAISQRVSKLEKKSIAKAPANASKAAASCWDIKAAAEENYARAIAMLDTCERDGDKVRVIAEVRQHLQFSMQVIEALYNVQETQAFMEEVLNIVEQCEPGSRDKILSRIRERRTLRSAFNQS